MSISLTLGSAGEPTKDTRESEPTIVAPECSSSGRRKAETWLPVSTRAGALADGVAPLVADPVEVAVAVTTVPLRPSTSVTTVPSGR